MTRAKTQTPMCHHGRPLEGGDWIRGVPACEDCEREEWQAVRVITAIGVAFLALLILGPLVMLAVAVL